LRSGLSSQHGGNPIEGQGLAEQIALRLVAPQRAQELRLLTVSTHSVTTLSRSECASAMIVDTSVIEFGSVSMAPGIDGLAN